MEWIYRELKTKLDAHASVLGTRVRESIEFHNGLMAFLVTTGKAAGLDAKTEVQVPGGNRADRIDVGWFAGKKLVTGIEVDSSSRQKSIRKLLACGAGRLFIVYYGKKEEKMRKELAESDSAGRITLIVIDKRLAWYDEP